MKLLTLAIVTASLAAAPVCAQQPVPLMLDHSVAWTHEQTGVVVPASIASIPRNSATAFATGGWDQSLQFVSSDNATVVSVYIYQAAVQDVGMLLAEAQKSLEGRVGYYGQVTPLAPPTAFAPPGDDVMSGLKIIYATTGQYSSTALAIAPVGREWIVKFRISSKDKTPQQLDTLLGQSIGAIGWPKVMPHGIATLPADCATPMAFISEAKAVRGDSLASSLMGSLIGMLPPASTADDPATGEKGIRYCRDTSVSLPFGLYRPGGKEDRYVLSLGDSGRAVFVEPDFEASVLSSKKAKKNGRTAYSIRLVVPGQSLSFQQHDRMIPPEQAVRIISTGQVISSANRGSGVITVNTGDSR